MPFPAPRGSEKLAELAAGGDILPAEIDHGDVLPLVGVGAPEAAAVVGQRRIAELAFALIQFHQLLPLLPVLAAHIEGQRGPLAPVAPDRVAGHEQSAAGSPDQVEAAVVVEEPGGP